MQEFLPVRCLNQYCMWEKEISHQDCIHHGLIIRATYLPPLSREMELNTRKPGVQYLFHVGFPTWEKKKKTFWVDFFKFPLVFFFLPLQRRTLEFSPYERSPCCQNPWNMLCSVPDFCCILSLRTDGSGIIYQTEKTGCFRLHRAAIHFQKGPPVLQTLISLPRDLRCRQVRGTRSRISHIHCIPDPFAQYLGAPPGATVDPSGLRRQADVGKKEWGACREVKRAQCIRSATPLVLYTDSCAL